MKNLMLITTLLLSLNSFAQTPFFELGPSDSHLTSITESEVISQRLLCEDYSCFINGTHVTIELPLGGCLDRLGPVTYTAQQEGNTIVITLAAIRVINRKSTAAFCLKEPTETIELSLPNMYGRVQVNMLKFR